MPENDNEFGKIIAKAWRDPAFKAELIANPAAALKAEGIDVPAGMAVTVVENTDKQFHLVLPPVPSGELSDEALDGVAGGLSQLIMYRNFEKVFMDSLTLIRNSGDRSAYYAELSRFVSLRAARFPDIVSGAIPI